jgi:hypothetical protein
MKPLSIETKLAAHFLKQYSESLSNNGCNDLDDDVMEILATWTDEQKELFMRDASAWNKGNIELDSPEEMPDWMIADVLAYQLEKQ